MLWDDDGNVKEEYAGHPSGMHTIDDPNVRVYTKETYMIQRRRLRHDWNGIPFVFDKLLDGHGLPFGEITELVGISCTGKTSIAMQTAINCLTSSPKYHVIYIGRNHFYSC